ncbi:transmembrane amino acid transporter protein-domain-containing protein [Lentinula aciculospora]|uniref:Transmembrane amino acid transporter protein-domain-containing protein n=1 Tax=Lentinula aciculospora TaxID=153920 RepID=A0A9W9AU57_9AGAR|nr:transmembrane amino acid transporter protein-domain-containing protein [Lentinula aciculospora]
MSAPQHKNVAFDTEKIDIKRTTSVLSSDSSAESLSVGVQIARESEHEIKYRTCSWQKTAALLFSEYICLAMVSFPWSFSVLGMVPGVIVTVTIAATCLYTSLILGRFCIKHPEMRDVCDIGQYLFGGSQLAYNLTAMMFILNNVFVQALHVITGAKYLNTVTNSSECSLTFGAITAIICFLVSLPRTLNQMSGLGTFSAITMGIAVLLTIIFSGVESHPFGYIANQEPLVTAIPVPGTTYVAGMSAFLNITYTFVGQVMIPTFIAEMENPKDFPKALWAVTIAEVVTYTICGAVVYHFVGNQYVTAPAFGSLTRTYKIIAFSFAVPTIIFLGALYSNVAARFVFFRMFRESRHRHSNTVVGWGVWVALVAATWILAWIIGEVIPFFSDMLSLMSSLFDGWFGFIFWAMAYLTLYPGDSKWDGPLRSAETLVNYFFILLGAYITVAGTYTSVESIIESYQTQEVRGVFTCASNAL